MGIAGLRFFLHAECASCKNIEQQRFVWLVNISVTHTTAFLARQVQVLVLPRTGRTSTSFFFGWRSAVETETSTKVRTGCVLMNF